MEVVLPFTKENLAKILSMPKDCVIGYTVGDVADESLMCKVFERNRGEYGDPEKYSVIWQCYWGFKVFRGSIDELYEATVWEEPQHIIYTDYALWHPEMARNILLKIFWR